MAKTVDERTFNDLLTAANDVRAAADIYNNAVMGAQEMGLSINPVFSHGAKITINSITAVTKF